jgi:prepilin-type N-terminal cleavage/methylation domain-containing protein
MYTKRRPGCPPGAGDAGFTLIEVIVAMVLLSLVMVGVGGLFMRAVTTTSSLDRRQSAVTVADQAIELARSIPPAGTSANDSKLVSGRYKPLVDAQWAATTADLSQTDEAWDPNATAGSSPALKLSTISTVSSVGYTAQILVGSCWRPATGNGDCVKNASKVAGALFTYRVIVVVTWSEGAGRTCSGSQCNYVLSTLVDPSGDPTFNVNATNAVWPNAPMLTTKTVHTALNTPVSVSISDVLTTTVPLANLTLTVTSVTPSGEAHPTDPTHLLVTPVNGYWSGQNVVVTYTVTDPYQQTATSTINVTVDPPAAPATATGTLYTPKNTSATIDLATLVSGGTGGLSYAFTQPGGTTGSVTLVSGTTVRYAPPGSTWTGSTSFTYTVQDTYGHSIGGTVNVTVMPPLTAGNHTYSIAHNNWLTIDLSSLVNGGATPYSYGTSNLSGGTLNPQGGSVYKFKSTTTTGSPFTFQYTVTDSASQTATGIITVTVT